MYNTEIVRHGEIEKKTSMHVSRMSRTILRFEKIIVVIIEQLD